MTPATAKLDALRPLLGPDALSEREGLPVASPGTTEEVAVVTRFAHANQLTIEITGAGTKRTWGNPVAADLLLSTTRLTGVREHSWQDLTATVAAGTHWADMQRALSAHNQFVALDPLWPDTATVGGIIATNDSGALRLRYGSLRDLIIGMTIVLADGTIARSGGKVVKNVAGYDLHKLMAGAYGTLGIVTEVTFRLHPLPRHCQTFTVSAPQASQLAPLMAAITDSHLLLEAMQLRGDPSGFHLDIQLNAHPDANQPDILRSMVTASKVSLGFSPGIETGHRSGFSPWSMPSPPVPPQENNEASIAGEERDHGGSSGLQAAESDPPHNPGFSHGPFTNVWQARETLFANDNAFVVKASMLPTDVVPFGERVLALDGVFVAQAIGIMIASFDAPGHTTGYGVETLREELERRNGGLDILSYPIPSWSGLPPNRINSTALPLMQSIKRQFDPNRTLNPGRFLGGI